MPVKFIVILILATFIAIFAVKNLEPVEVSFYDVYFNSHNVQIPLFIVIMVSMGFGFFLGWFDGWIAKVKLKNHIRKQDKTIHSLNQQIDQLSKPSLPEYNPSKK
ncbi:MAG: LapA family protein [Nitrospinota bacterium]|nr:LapA family protein [Nitrospinota bacterium]